jgi:DNA mismatch repair protein MutL
VDEAAAAPGTQIEVTDLFFNTPARKKFLKSVATEFSHISQIVQQAALCWPRVAFALRHNGQSVCDYPAVTNERDRLFQVYGGPLVASMLTVQAERSGCRLQGFAVTPDQARNSRSPQELFVNGRPVKNATVAHAVYDGYAPSLAKGRHPVFVLFLLVDRDRLDVNVHPTKREVRFADQELIHQLVRHGIRTALGADAPAGSPGGSPAVPHGGSFDGNVTTAGETAPLLFVARESAPTYRTVAGVSEPDIIPFGQISSTFLVAQVGTDLHVVDQHTAHERVLFERLWRSWVAQRVPIQPLLLPEPFDLPPDRAALLSGSLEHLARLGLEIEPFGTGSFVVRGVPAQLGRLDYPGLIQDILDDLTEWGPDRSSSLEQRLRPVAASLACHGAVRAGRAMELAEIKQLLSDWVEEGLPMTCPHGRRVALRLPAEELAKIFGRV